MALYSRRCVLSFIAAAIPMYPQAPASGPYYVAFLRPDPSRKTLEKAESDRVQAAHMENIRSMARDGVLVAAGPFEDIPRTISGIFVFTVDSLQSARRIAAQDPTVIEHRNTVDVHAWQGPAGIGVEYARLHKLDPKTPENMQVHPLLMLHHGAAWDQKTSERDELLRAHVRFADDLRRQGKLSAGGSVEAPDDLVDILIFKPMPDGEAQSLMLDDPAVKAGVLRVENHRWWCSDHVLPW
jgi:uncharacterized protein YciI